ncbi:MAG: Ig-like domain-containing domain [Muribaculaceae bacterium]
MKPNISAYFIISTLIASVLVSCANIGRPSGGPRDETPPVYVSSNPNPDQLNFNGSKITINFNEYIQLKDQNTKVVVSPAQKNMPIIRASGKSVSVELRDTLLPNTTYCIDFADAIQDNNESNPLDGFAFAFSTGDSIDSLQVSGIMLRADDLEPMQGIIVGIHENLNDSAFSTIPLTRIARTNDYGQFTIRNMKPGRYHLFGLKDMDGNYTFSRNEDLAFLDEIIIPSSHQRETTDTIFKFNGEIDTIQPGVHTVFTPNDLLLCMFNEQYSALYLKKSERPVDNKLHIKFSAPVDTLPDLRLLKPTATRPDWYRIERTPSNDSIFYWLTDSALIKSDSVLVEARYLVSDSLDNLVMTTDTINFFFRHKVDKKKKTDKHKSDDKDRKIGDKIDSDGKISKAGDESKKEKPANMFDSIPTLSMKIEQNIDYGKPLPITFETPIDTIDLHAFHIFEKEPDDTLWRPSTRAKKLVPFDSVSVMKYHFIYPFDAGSMYRIEIDSLSIYDCYGRPNKPQKVEFNIPPLEEYANLYMLVNVQDSAFVELLDGNEKVILAAPVKDGTAALENVRPGTYYARIILDANGNGKWDTGNYALHLQPEEVYYFPNKILLRKNWDNEQTWNIYETAIDKQKPFDIKKNRSQADIKRLQKMKRDKNGRDQDEDDEEDPWGGNQQNNYTGNKYNDARNSLGGNNQRIRY